MSIPVIDLFAGPGGLGEGFSSFEAPDRTNPFQIGLSIEKDEHAHRTLELRSFFRKFPKGQAPDAYYRYLRGEVTREQLFKSFKREAKEAWNEAWKAELGARGYRHSDIDRRIVRALGGQEHWVLVGGPPCQAYSIAGRSRMGGNKAATQEQFEQDRRHLLYKQYLRIIARHRPTIFIMENVKGILSSKMKGDSIFSLILKDLRHPTRAIEGQDAEVGERLAMDGEVIYNIFPLVRPPRLDFSGEFLSPSDYVVRAEEFGVPQARHRVFLLGVRADVGIEHGDEHFLTPTEQRRTAQDVIGDLPGLRSQISRGGDSLEAWHEAVRDVEAQQWLAQEGFTNLREMICEVARNVNGHLTSGAEWMDGATTPAHNPDNWYTDPMLNGVCNHSARSHRADDLHRYLFASVYAHQNERSPMLRDFPTELLPDHGNVAQAIKTNDNFSDRFRVQLRDRPSTTVLAHISKDGHYFIHYDPNQCRSLTVREAARLQTFPDNYFFEGPRTEQYHQVGNAVPPLLARQIAAFVYKLLGQRAE